MNLSFNDPTMPCCGRDAASCDCVHNCEHCGEALGDQPRAEVYTPSHPERDSIIVHAEPCATELMKQGYDIA